MNSLFICKKLNLFCSLMHFHRIFITSCKKMCFLFFRFYPQVRNATAYFIINLSACDLMFCCFNLPLQASMFWNRQWVHGDTLCRLFPLFRYGLMAVSIFTVLAITINRYVMIGHPRVYPRYVFIKYSHTAKSTQIPLHAKSRKIFFPGFSPIH